MIFYLINNFYNLWKMIINKYEKKNNNNNNNNTN